MDLVQATQLLAGATFLLVVGQIILAALGVLQYVAARRQAADQRRATYVLETQAKALQTTATANEAIAEETRATRIEDQRGACRLVYFELVQNFHALFFERGTFRIETAAWERSGHQVALALTVVDFLQVALIYGEIRRAELARAAGVAAGEPLPDTRMVAFRAKYATQVLRPSTGWTGQDDEYVDRLERSQFDLADQQQTPGIAAIAELLYGTHHPTPPEGPPAPGAGPVGAA